MAAGPTITARFVADTSKMTAGVDQATSGMGSSIKSFAKGAAVALGGAFAATAVVDFAKQSIDAASDLQESISKVGVVFGKAGDDIIKWSENASTAMGMSQQQALEAAGTYGNLAVSLGLPQQQASDMSTSLVQLAADMASFNNVPVDEALNALRSGLTGETEPLKRFGVNLNEAALKAKAMSMGLSDGKGPLDAAAKAQASYALIMEQSTTAQGDFARTADGLANKTKTSAAQFEDMKAKLGTALLPVMNAIVGVITNQLLPAFEAIGGWIADNKELFIALGVALGVVGTVVLASLVPAFIAWAAAAWAALVPTLLMWAPIIAIGAAVAAVAFVIIKNWDSIKAATAAVWGFILGTIQAVWNWIKTNWPLLLAILTGPFGIAVGLIVRNWDTIKSAAAAVWDFIKSAAQGTYNFMVGVFQGLANAITAPIKSAWNALAGIWNSTVGKIEISIPKFVPLVGGQSFGVPDLPRLAAGGIVTRPTIALIGEAGPEAVVPLGRGGDLGAGDTIYNINVTAGIGDPAELGRSVIDAIRAAERVQGKGWRAA